MRLGKILKFAFVAVMLVFFIFLFSRIMMTGDRTALRDVSPTEGARAAFAADGEDAFLTNTLPSDISRDGYFTAYALAFAPAAKELQITVRYNDSLYEKYLEGSDPETYYFEIRDAEGNTVSKAKVVGEKERYFYNHLRLSFEGIEGGEELYLFLCCDSASYPADHTEGILITHPSLEMKKLRLSSGEKEALGE